MILSQTVYSDSAAGAVAALCELVDPQWIEEFDLSTAVVFPDPWVKGVWAIDSMKTGERVIVELAGYHCGQVFGVKKNNDFEVTYITKTDMKQYVETKRMKPSVIKAVLKQLVA